MKTILRALSIFLVAFLLIGAIPIGASAAEVASEFEYSILDNGTVEVTKYVNDNNKKVIIPEMIDGKIVTSVSRTCFNEFTGPADGFKNVESIFIPKTINNLGEYQVDYAKDECWTFCKLPNLKEIIVDNQNTNYSSIEGVLFDKSIKTLLYYPRSKMASEYITPSTVSSIKKVSFYQNIFLKKLKFGSILDEIVLDAIYNLEVLEYPIIKNKVDNGVIRTCYNLSRVIIDKDVTFIPENEFSEGFRDKPVLYVYDNTYGIEWAKAHDFPYEIMEEPPVEKELVDEQTGIQVSGLMDADAVLNVEVVENTLEDAVSTFNITLEKDGNIIQPDGTITITIPSEYGDCNVFWVKDDGIKVDMNAEYINGSYVFTTDHLSVYALIKSNSEVYGDINGDNVVSIQDATVIQKYLSDQIELSDGQIRLADVNKDGAVTVTDATLIQKYIADLVDALG